MAVVASPSMADTLATVVVCSGITAEEFQQTQKNYSELVRLLIWLHRATRLDWPVIVICGPLRSWWQGWDSLVDCCWEDAVPGPVLCYLPPEPAGKSAEWCLRSRHSISCDSTSISLAADWMLKFLCIAMTHGQHVMDRVSAPVSLYIHQSTTALHNAKSGQGNILPSQCTTGAAQWPGMQSESTMGEMCCCLGIRNTHQPPTFPQKLLSGMFQPDPDNWQV